MRFLPVLVLFVVWLYGVLDVLLAPGTRMRHLPKAAWLALTLLVPVLGSVAWLVVSRLPERAEPQTPRPKGRVTDADLEAYRRRLRRQVEEQRRRHHEPE